MMLTTVRKQNRSSFLKKNKKKSHAIQQVHENNNCCPTHGETILGFVLCEAYKSYVIFSAPQS